MQLRRESQIERYHPDDLPDYPKVRERRRSQVQPSPPSTPRQEQRFPQPSIRRHSFATRKEPPVSPRVSLRADRGGSPRITQSYIDETEESPRIQRSPSPSSSVRSNAGSTASTASALPPVQPSNRTTPRH